MGSAGSICDPVELYADLLDLLTTDQRHATTYWSGCKSAHGFEQEALNVVRGAAEGRMPSWFAATYHGANGEPDLERLWADVKGISASKSRAATVFQLRNEFGGYCDRRKATESAFENGVTRNPWRDGGCVPAAPRDVAATAVGGGKLTVSWDPPADDGGSPIEGYKVQWKSGTEAYDSSRQAEVTDLERLSHTIESLTSGVDHSVRVVAYNHNGGGADSVEATATAVAQDGTAPQLSAATADGASLVLTWNETLDETSVPVPGAFEVSAGGTARGIGRVSVTGDRVTLTLTSAVAVGEAVTLSYAVPAGANASPLRDTAMNAAAGLSGHAVRNDTTAVTIVSDPGADVTYIFHYGHSSQDFIELTVTFSERVTVTGVPELALQVGTVTKQAAYAGGSGTTTLTFRYVVADGDTDADGVSVPAGRIGGGGTIQYLASNDAAPARVSLAAQPGHRVDGVRPALVSIKAVANGNVLTLTWDKVLDENSVPGWGDNRGFQLWDLVDGWHTPGPPRDEITAVSISGAVVTLELSSAIQSGDQLVVSYTVPYKTYPPLLDTLGNYAGNNRAVIAIAASESSNTPPTGLPAISGTAQVGATLTASADAIVDADGLENVEFAWQWIANDGAADADITGATAATYTLTAADLGNTIKVRATFTDDGGTEETLVSAATVAVAETQPLVPEITLGGGGFTVDEGETMVTTLTMQQIGQRRSDSVWSIPQGPDGGEDADAFTLEPDGVLSFRTAKDYESPDDADGDGEYEVTAQFGTRTASARADLVISLRNVNEAPVADAGADIAGVSPGASVTLDGSGSSDPDRDDTLTWRWTQTDSSGYAVVLSDAAAKRPTFTIPSDIAAEAVLVFTLRVTDAGGLFAEDSVRVSVVPPPAEAPAGTTEVLWSGDVTVTDYGGAFGAITADSFTNVTVDELDVEWIWYSVGVRRLDLILSEAATAAGELTLHLGDVALAFPQGSSGETIIRWRPIRLSWRNGQTVAVRLTRTSQAPEPVNTSPTGLPAIAGTPRVGEALRASVSGIADADGLSGAAFRYQWLSHDGTADTAIPGATQAVYTLAASDAGNTIKVRVSFTDDRGTEETLTSVATAAVEATVPDAPRNLSIAAPDGKEGLLEVSWQAPDSDGGSAVAGYKVQWRSGSEDYDGTAASTRQAVVTDLAGLTHTITGLTNGVAYTVRVIATNGVGDGAATAAVTGTPRDRVRPQLAAAAVDGDTLTLTWNEALDEGSTPWWYSFDVSVRGAARGITAVSVSGSTVSLTLASAVAAGDPVTVLYVAPSPDDRIKDAAGNEALSFLSESVTNNTPAPVNTPPTGLPMISGPARVGETLTTSASGIADVDGLSGATFAWQWISNDGAGDTDIAGATQAVYTLAVADAGKTIKVQVTFTDDGGTEETLTSAATAEVEAAVPDAPRNLTLAVPNRAEGALQVSWAAPAGGAAVTDYTVQWKSGSEDYDATDSSTRQATVTDPANLRYTITGLTNGVAYTVRVIAVNDAGDGTASGETTGTPLSLVSQLRHFIENDIVAVHGAAHPWLRAAWRHMNGPGFRLRVFDSLEGPGVHNVPDDANGYVLSPCRDVPYSPLRRCRSTDMGIRDAEIDSPLTLVHEMAHIYTASNELSSDPIPLGVAHVYFEQIGLRSGNRLVCSGREIYADILTKLVLGDVRTSYWDGHGCGAAGQTQEALSVARSALGGQMPQWFAATYHDADGDPDLEAFWADVGPESFARHAVTYQLRNAFGGYCENLPSAALWSGAVTRNPWRDGGCVPAAPGGLTATAVGSGKLNVVWDPPAHDGGSPIEGYQVQWKSGSQDYDSSGRAATIGPEAWLHTIDGLTNGIEYAVRMVAYNQNGDGAAAEAAGTPVAAETIAPELSMATVTGATLVLTYDEALDEASQPGASAFAVQAGVASREVAQVVVSGNAVTLTLASAVISSDEVTVHYVVPEGPGAKPIRDVTGNNAAPLFGRTVRNDTIAEVISIAITSDPGPDRTYTAMLGTWGEPEVIEVTLTFSERVTVTGAPVLPLDAGKPPADADSFLGAITFQSPYSPAGYHGGSGTATLTFRYTASEGDHKPDGVSVPARRWSPQLYGGTIKDGANKNAVLTHSGLAAQPGHKVDGVRPAPIAGGAVANGTTLTLTFDEPLAEDSVPTPGYGFSVTGRTVTGIWVDGAVVTLALNVPVSPGDEVYVRYTVPYYRFSDAIRDAVGNLAGNFYDHAVTVLTDDTMAPRATRVDLLRASGHSSTYVIGESFDVAVTFNESVTVDATNGSPSLGLNVGDVVKQAVYHSGTGTAVLTFRYTVEENDEDTDGVRVEPGDIVANGGTIRDGSGNDAVLTLPEQGTTHRILVDGVRPALTATNGVTVSSAGNLHLNWSESLHFGSVPEAGAFTIAGGAVSRSVAEVWKIGDSRLELNITPRIEHGETGITLAYEVPTGPDASPVRDLYGNTAAAFSGQAVADIAQPPQEPRNLVVAPVVGREGVLQVSWDAPLSDGGSAITAYSVYWRIEYSGPLSGATVTDLANLTYTITGLTNGVSYRVRVRAINGVGGGAWSSRIATPGDRVRPELSAAVVAGETLTLTWSEALDESSEPAADAFAVSVAGVARGVTEVSVAGSTVALTLASAVAADDVVTVSYTVPAAPDAPRIEDTAGNDAAAFSGAAVTNNTSDPVNTPPTGLPTVSGTARVGETLTASVTEIADADGLGGATFTYQWMRSDGTTDTDIADATQVSYTLVAADQGKTIKVRATFIDDGGTEEALTSAATAVVQDSLTLSVSDARATEGALVEFTVSLSAASSQQVTVQYATSGGTAESGTDFTAASGMLTFAANETSKTVSVATTADAADEDNETFTLTLSSPTNATLGDATATGTINDDEPEDTVSPTVSVQCVDLEANPSVHRWEVTTRCRGSYILASGSRMPMTPALARLR